MGGGEVLAAPEVGREVCVCARAGTQACTSSVMLFCFVLCVLVRVLKQHAHSMHVKCVGRA